MSVSLQESLEFYISHRSSSPNGDALSASIVPLIAGTQSMSPFGAAGEVRISLPAGDRLGRIRKQIELAIIVSTELTKPQSEKIRDFTQRLLAYEGAAGDSSGTNNSPSFRASEKLRRSLSMLAGVHGYRTLLGRALTLAKRETGSLSTVQIEPDGSLKGLGDLSNEQAAEAGRTLITQLLELLETFVGESLATTLAHDVWPDLPGDDPNSGKVSST